MTLKYDDTRTAEIARAYFPIRESELKLQATKNPDAKKEAAFEVESRIRVYSKNIPDGVKRALGIPELETLCRELTCN